MSSVESRGDETSLRLRIDEHSGIHAHSLSFKIHKTINRGLLRFVSDASKELSLTIVKVIGSVGSLFMSWIIARVFSSRGIFVNLFPNCVLAAA